jgi:hypothetical protein
MTKPTSEQVTFLAAGAGATQRTALDKLRDVVSVKDFGAVGDGVADDTAAFNAATAAVSATQILVFPSGTYKTVGNVTLTVPVRLDGKIEMSAGSVLAFTKTVIADRLQIFVLGAGASVTFAAGTLEEVFPEWWGAVADGITDCAVAIKQANDSFGRVSFGSGVYATSPIKVGGMGKTWCGVQGNSGQQGSNRTIIRAITASTQNTVLQHQGHWNLFENIDFDGNAKTQFVVALTQLTLGTKFVRCSFLNPITNNGICVFNTSTNAPNIATVVNPGVSPTLQGDTVNFIDCLFASDGTGYGYFSEGSNAFLCNITRSVMQNLEYGVWLYGTGVYLDEVQFDVAAVLRISGGCQSTSITRCYCENNCSIISAINQLGGLPQNRLYMAHNYWNATVTAQIPAGVHVVSINNYQADGYMSFLSPVGGHSWTEYGQNISIGDSIVWTGAAPLDLQNLTVLGGMKTGIAQAAGGPNAIPYGNITPAMKHTGYIELVNAGSTPNYGNNRTVMLSNSAPQNVVGFVNNNNYLQFDRCEEIIVYGDSNTTLVHATTGPTPHIRLQGNTNVVLGSIKNITLQRSGGGYVWKEIARTT